MEDSVNAYLVGLTVLYLHVRCVLLSRLTDVYARKLDILNRGLSGYNTEWAIPVFEQVGARDGAYRTT